MAFINALCTSVGLEGALWTRVLRRHRRSFCAIVTFIAFVELLTYSPVCRTISNCWTVVTVRTGQALSLAWVELELTSHTALSSSGSRWTHLISCALVIKLSECFGAGRAVVPLSTGPLVHLGLVMSLNSVAVRPSNDCSAITGLSLLQNVAVSAWLTWDALATICWAIMELRTFSKLSDRGRDCRRVSGVARGCGLGETEVASRAFVCRCDTGLAESAAVIASDAIPAGRYCLLSLQRVISTNRTVALSYSAPVAVFAWAAFNRLRQVVSVAFVSLRANHTVPLCVLRLISTESRGCCPCVARVVTAPARRSGVDRAWVDIGSCLIQKWIADRIRNRNDA